MLTFQQSETTAERRRWVIVLVDSTDGVTGLTGQTGQVKLSKNGSPAIDSTNSLVEVDAGDMPGHYYVELTASELDTLGFVSITAKTAGSLAFHDRALVSYNDPYISAGGFASGGGSGQGFRLLDKHIEAIAKKVWEYQIQENVTAQDKLLQAAEHPLVDIDGVSQKISDIVIPELDLSPVIERIDNIVIPQPKDYSKTLKSISDAVDSLGKIVPADLSKLFESIEIIKSNAEQVRESIGLSQTEITTLKGDVIEFQKEMKELDHLIERFGDTLDQRTDIEKRFNQLSERERNIEFDNLVSKVDTILQRLPKLAESIVQAKYDILGEIK